MGCCGDENNNNNGDEQGPCGTCLPYRDAVLITGQALSIGAWLLSISDVISFLLGTAAMIMLNITFCCKMNKCGLIVAGVFACIAAVGCIAYGIVFASGTACPTYACQDYYDGYYYVYCTCNHAAWAAIAFIGGLLWIGSGTCTFIFACGNRMKKFTDNNDDNDDKNGNIQQASAVTAIPQGGPQDSKTTTTTTTTSNVVYSQGQQQAQAPTPRQAEMPLPQPAQPQPQPQQVVYAD